MALCFSIHDQYVSTKAGSIFMETEFRLDATGGKETIQFYDSFNKGF